MVVSEEGGGAIGDVLLFLNPGQPGDSILWRSDGTADGTFPLADVTPQFGAAVGSRFVFPGSNYCGAGIWSTDGTEAGTALLAPFRQAYGKAVSTYDALYVLADSDSTGLEIWQSDGTVRGTGVLDFTPGAVGTAITALARFRSGIVFVVSNHEGQELWRLDAPNAEPYRIRQFAGSQPIGELTDAGGTLYIPRGRG